VLKDFSSVTHAVNRSIPAQAGIGLRLLHHTKVLSEIPAMPCFEVHAESFMTY
jgi:hypothetical protein